MKRLIQRLFSSRRLEVRRVQPVRREILRTRRR